MEIPLDRDLEAALRESARRLGTFPEVLAAEALRERFLNRDVSVQPRDEWERALLSTASDCGVSLSEAALSSDGIYE